MASRRKCRSDRAAARPEPEVSGFAPANNFRGVAARARFWLRASRLVVGLEHMGAKYLPTIKDQKANLRFQQKQNPLRKFKKSNPVSGKKGKGK